jgi:alpha-beta hydrolase superfamily lysophospholipase
MVVILVVHGVLFFFQEKFIFFPQRLSKNYQFSFDHEFEEINLKSYDGAVLNGLLFKSDNSKGLIFYLHGNGGSLMSWGEVASTYTNLGFDIFMLDYRGYGKSEGTINNEEQLSKDVQIVYDELKKSYAEDKIIVLGYSLGTGLATKLASSNSPSLLILQAPFFSLTKMMNARTYYIVPSFILKYKFETNKYLRKCKMPIVIFHGTNDEVISYESSVMLKELFKPSDMLITLHNQGHSNMTDSNEYKAELRKIF